MQHDRLKNPLARLVRRFTGQGQRGTGALLDYCALYRGEVTAVASDALLLSVRPSDPRLPEYTRIPYAPPWGGVAPQPVVGSQCLVGYAGGRPDDPYVAHILGSVSRVDVDAPLVQTTGTVAPLFLGQAGGVPSATPGTALGGGTATCSGGGVLFSLEVVVVTGAIGTLAQVVLAKDYASAPQVARLSDGGLTGVSETVTGRTLVVSVSSVPSPGTKTLKYLVVG